MASPAEFVDAARAYLGVRWSHLGRSREGVDCVGLLLCAADDAGMTHDMPPPYPRGHRGLALTDACERIGKPVSLNDAKDGDVLAFTDGIFCSHLGIRSTQDGIPYVIHARVNRRKVVEEPLTHELLDALRRAYRPFAFSADTGDVS